MESDVDKLMPRNGVSVTAKPHSVRRNPTGDREMPFVAERNGNVTGRME